jgi:hypothetical protein
LSAPAYPALHQTLNFTPALHQTLNFTPALHQTLNFTPGDARHTRLALFFHFTRALACAGILLLHLLGVRFLSGARHQIASFLAPETNPPVRPVALDITAGIKRNVAAVGRTKTAARYFRGRLSQSCAVFCHPVHPPFTCPIQSPRLPSGCLPKPTV